MGRRPDERTAGWVEGVDLDAGIKWKEAHRKRAIKSRQWEKVITNLARHERIYDRHIKIHTPSGSRLVNIEATYGPLIGRPGCTILVWFGARAINGISVFDECRQRRIGSIPRSLDEIPAVFTEAKGIGPRAFLTQVFRVIGYFGGMANVTMKRAACSSQ